MCPQPDFAAELKAKVASNPELYKLIEAKINEVCVRGPQACFVSPLSPDFPLQADKPGVRATVDAPKGERVWP